MLLVIREMLPATFASQGPSLRKVSVSPVGAAAESTSRVSLTLHHFLSLSFNLSAAALFCSAFLCPSLGYFRFQQPLSPPAPSSLALSSLAPEAQRFRHSLATTTTHLSSIM